MTGCEDDDESYEPHPIMDAIFLEEGFTPAELPTWRRHPFWFGSEHDAPEYVRLEARQALTFARRGFSFEQAVVWRSHAAAEHAVVLRDAGYSPDEFSDAVNFVYRQMGRLVTHPMLVPWLLLRLELWKVSIAVTLELSEAEATRLSDDEWKRLSLFTALMRPPRL